MERGYDVSQRATYKQWQSLGAQVKQGQRGNTIIIYKPLTSQDDSSVRSSDDKNYRPRVLISSATVFNVNQVTGWQPEVDLSKPITDLTSKVIKAESFVSRTKAPIYSGGSMAYYDRVKGQIKIPDRNLFTGTVASTPTEAYYSTLLHELVNWSGHGKRYCRDLSARFGAAAYAKEELVAELGAAFLCAELGISVEPRADHASYINSWIQVLKDGNTATFWAAARASDAVAYLNRLQVRPSNSQPQAVSQ